MLPGGVKEWLYQNAIAFDQQVNAITGGFADETMSARCYRLNHRNPYKWFEQFINVLFMWQGWDHCKKAYEKEYNGRQRPAEKN